MKKYLGIFILLAVSLCMISCQKSEPNETDASREDDTSKTTVEEFTAGVDDSKKNDTNRTVISGEFTVGVRDVIPDYCYDQVTPCVALVTEYQSYPFTIFIENELGAQLKEELETQSESRHPYVFRIEPVAVNYSVEELEKKPLSSLVWEISDLKITGFRLAEEGEFGMNSLGLTFTEEMNYVQKQYADLNANYKEFNRLTISGSDSRGEILDENGQIYFPLEKENYKSAADVQELIERTFSSHYTEQYLRWALNGEYPMFKDIDGQLCIALLENICLELGEKIDKIEVMDDHKITFITEYKDESLMEETTHRISLIWENEKWLIDEIEYL